MRALLVLAAALCVAAPALADPVTLKVNPEDVDGQVTLGDIFDGAGAASGVLVARRAGPSVVLDAGQLQSQARQVGLDWANATGLRRVVVRRAFAAAPEAAPGAPAAQPAAAAPLRAVRAAPAVDVINRNDMVQVAFVSEGVRLTVVGRATRDAAVGEPVPVLNLQSGRTIAAVASGPGRAVAGPGAQDLRATQFAAR